MPEPIDYLPHVGTGAAGVGLGAWLLKQLLGRQAAALDGTLTHLDATCEDLRKEEQLLRETQVGLAKDIGTLQAEVKAAQGRIDGMGTYWRERFDAIAPPTLRKK